MMVNEALILWKSVLMSRYQTVQDAKNLKAIYLEKTSKDRLPNRDKFCISMPLFKLS